MNYLALLLIFFLNAAVAASFDCRKAATLIEKDICSNTTLSELDEALADRYKGVRSSNIGEGAKRQLKLTQRAWLKERDGCSNTACIESKYRQRMEELCEYPVISGVNWACTSEPEIPQKPTNLDDLQGWWRSDDPELEWGCNDSDNQYRIAIGRWNFDNTTGRIKFDNSLPPRIGFYEASCILKDATPGPGYIAFRSDCVSDGEKISGLTTIEIVSHDSIKLQTPVTHTTGLVRCPPADDN